MIIQNKFENAKNRIIYFGFLSATIISFAFTAITDTINNQKSGIISGILFLCIYIVLFFIKYDYVWFSDNGNKFIFRFFFSHPFLQKPKAMEFPKSFLSDFNIESSFFKLKHLLKINLTTSKGVTYTQKISLSGWNKKSINDLRDVLGKQVQLNRQLK